MYRPLFRVTGNRTRSAGRRRQFGFTRILLLAILPIFAFAACASTRANAADAPQAVAAQIERGRVLLGLRDARAAAVLQDAAQTSLDVLRRASADERAADFAPPRESAARVQWRRALLDALDAHRWRAASQIAARDDEAAVETLALQMQLAHLESENEIGAGASRENSALAEARAQLISLLPDGAPSHATFATLQRLARFFYESAPPHLEDFSLPLPSQNVVRHIALFDAPLSPHGANDAASTRVAPLYRAYASAALPPSLQMDRAVFAYQADDETHWKLMARVFYASPQRTENARDDAPRARFLASRFMKIAALQRALWGLKNPQITNIWLLEKAADWPQQSETSNEDEAKNFRAGGWIENAPADIFLFRAAVPRSDFGWTRQLMHEYSHVVWPRFGGFAPPLEPYADGLLGETLMALQFTQLKIARAFCDDETADLSAANFSRDTASRDLSGDDAASRVSIPRDDIAAFLAATRTHIEVNALPALRLWNARGPHLPANQNGAESLRWAQGLTVFIERASGDETLSQVLREAKRREYSPQKSAAPPLLLSCYESVLRAQWKEKSRLDFQLSHDDFFDAETSPAKIGARFPLWIYVPLGATSVEVSWRETAPEKAAQLRVWLDGREAKSKNVAGKNGDVLSRVALEKQSGGWRKLEMQVANALAAFKATVR